MPTVPSVEELLIDPETRGALRFDGTNWVGANGERYALEDGILRMLRHVDRELAVELEAQSNGLEEYSSPAFLMPRYERDMARVALIEMFGDRRPAGCILDAGCGIGLLGRMYPDLGLIGLDASIVLLRQATSGYRFRVEASAEDMPFRDASFDVVVALNMLHHVIHPERAMQEFARVLKPGGTLIALDPRKVAPVELAKKLLRGNHAGFAPTHKAFTVREYEELLRADGAFHIEQQRRVGLLTLLSMGGLDALKLSPMLGAQDRIVDVLRRADEALFRVPGVRLAGLNLVVRARRSPSG